MGSWHSEGGTMNDMGEFIGFIGGAGLIVLVMAWIAKMK
jgi:hypothetical protein